MRRIWSQKVPMLYKYLLSYAIILIIPIAVLILAAYQHAVRNFEQQVIASQKQQLYQMMDMMDAKMQGMVSIAAELSTDPSLSPFRPNRDISWAIEAKKALRFTASESLFHELVYYIRNEETLYSAQSTYKLDRFLQDIYSFKSWTQDTFRVDLNTITKPVMRPVEQVQRGNEYTESYLTYIVPIPVNGIRPYGTALFIIQENELQRSMQRLIDTPEGNAFMLDQQGAMLASLHPVEQFDNSLLELAMQPEQDGQDGHAVIRLKNSDYIVSYVKSSITKMTYVTALPNAEVMLPVKEVKNRALLSLAVAILAGGALIFVVMQLNYRPLIKLFRNAEQRWGKAVTGWSELDLGMQQIESHNEQLNRQWRDSQGAVRNSLLLSLLRGQVSNIAEWNEMGREIGLQFHSNYFFVAIFELPKNLEQALLTDKIDQLLFDSMEGCRLEGLDVRQLVYVLASDKNLEQAAKQLEEIRELLEQHALPLTIGCGAMYTQLEELGKSYMEAYVALDYKLIKGKYRLICFTELEEAGRAGASAGAYPSLELDIFGVCLENGELDKIHESLARLLMVIEKSSSLHLARCIGYDVINTVIKKTGMSKEQIPDVFHLSRFETIQELVETVTDFYYRWFEQLELENQNRQEDILFCKMEDYIASHAFDPEFTLQTMADDLSYSVTYIKLYYKEKSGCTVMDKVIKIRMEKAKELLGASDMPLKELALQVGYYDSSSFIRRFRLTVGVTPGEYRKMFNSERGEMFGG